MPPPPSPPRCPAPPPLPPDLSVGGTPRSVFCPPPRAFDVPPEKTAPSPSLSWIPLCYSPSWPRRKFASSFAIAKLALSTVIPLAREVARHPCYTAVLSVREVLAFSLSPSVLPGLAVREVAPPPPRPRRVGCRRFLGGRNRRRGGGRVPTTRFSP